MSSIRAVSQKLPSRTLGESNRLEHVGFELHGAILEQQNKTIELVCVYPWV